MNKKTPIAASVILLAAATGFGWHGHRQLALARQEQQQLIQKAASLGITLDPTSATAGNDKRLNRGQRTDDQAVVRKTAVALIAFAKEIEALKASGSAPSPEFQERSMAFLEDIAKLNAKQLELLLTEFRSTPDLKEETRDQMAAVTLSNLASLDPQAVLKLASKSPELFTNPRFGNQAIAQALGALARQDPLGAAEWLMKNKEKNPELLEDRFKTSIIMGAGKKDPALAFKLVDELDFQNSQFAYSIILNAAKTPADREASLAALRAYTANITDEKKRRELLFSGINELCSNATSDGFETGSKWIENRNFSPEELEGITSVSLSHNIKPEENPQWITWFSAKLPADQSAKAVERLVGEWTRNDYKAAGEWLASAPDGETKNAAIKSYALTVVRYAPESAAQWAVTLPPGPERTNTLRSIYNNWPIEDGAGSAAFAKEHGIK